MNCFSEIFFSSLSQQKTNAQKVFSETKNLLILNIKKMKNLQEMSLQEMRETEGGFIWYVVGVVAVAILAVGVYNGYKDTEQAAKK